MIIRYLSINITIIRIYYLFDKEERLCGVKKILELYLEKSLLGKIRYNLVGGRKTTWKATYKVEILYNNKLLIIFGEGINYITGYCECIERNKLEEPEWTKEENFKML